MTCLKFARLIAFLFIISISITSCTSVDKTESGEEAGEIYAEELDEEELDVEAAENESAESTQTADNSAPTTEQTIEEELNFEATTSETPAAEEAPVEDTMDDLVAEEATQPPPAEPTLEPAPVAEAEAPAAETEAPFATDSEQVKVTNIRYVSRDGGSVVVETSAPATYRTRQVPEQNQLVIEVANAKLPEHLKRPYVTKDFGQNIASFSAYQEPGSTTARVVVQFSSPMSADVRQSGRSITMVPTDGSGSQMIAEGEASDEMSYGESEAVPVSQNVAGGANDPRILRDTALDTASFENTKFYGRPISIEVRDTPIREVINLIVEQSGANIVLSNEVDGDITLKLRQVPWDQALLIVMKSRNLGYVRQGSILRIAPYDSLQRETEAAKRVLDAQKAAEPMRVKVIPVNYGEADDLVKQVEPFLTRDRGRVVGDKRTNSLVVTDIPSVLDRVANLVKALDTPPVQVLIEGKVIEARERFSREFGIRWGLTGQNANMGSQVLRQNININTNAITAPTFSHGLNFGTIPVLGDLQSTLSLAEKEDLVKVVSSPRVVTLNNEKASILQGTNIPIRSATVTNGVTQTSVSYQPIEMRLEVTPQVNSDTDIVLDLTLKREFASNQSEFSGQEPEINRREAKTKVLVKNGQTAVVGGVYQSDANNIETGVPGLRSVPLLGWLFKSKAVTNDKTELLVFLTPRILNAEKALQRESSL